MKKRKTAEERNLKDRKQRKRKRAKSIESKTKI
jgi:hypothetical protein